MASRSRSKNAPPRVESLPPALTPQEEAALIAERLSALVDRQRAKSRAGAEAVTAPVAGQVVGARHSGRLLGNLLLTRGFIVDSELQYALARQASTGGALGQILVDLGLVAEGDLVELLAEQLRMEVVDPERLEVDPAILSLLPKHDARRLAALPWRRADGHVDVAMADPSDRAAVGELTGVFGAPLRLFLATRSGIDAAVERLYG